MFLGNRSGKQFVRTVVAGLRLASTGSCPVSSCSDANRSGKRFVRTVVAGLQLASTGSCPMSSCSDAKSHRFDL